MWVSFHTRPAKKSDAPDLDAGYLQVELLDERGAPVPGFARADCPRLTGDHPALRVQWTGGDTLPRQAVRARFHLKRAFLYGFAFEPAASGRMKALGAAAITEKEETMPRQIELRPYVWRGPYTEMRQQYATAHDPGLCADLRAPWMKDGDRLILRTSEIIGYPEGFFYDDHFPTQQLDTRGRDYRHIPFGWDVEKAPRELSASCTVPGKGWFGLRLASEKDYVDIELAVRNDSSDTMDYVDWYFCVVGHESPSVGDPTLERTFFYDGEKLRTLAEVSGAGQGEEMYLVHGPQGAGGFIPDLHAGHPRQSIHPMLPLVMVQTADGKHSSALGFERAHSIFSSPGNRCFHADPFFGLDLQPGEERAVRGRLYLIQGTPAEAVNRFRTDFPTGK